MKIITGKTATEHVNSEDDRGLYAGIFGSGSYVLNTGTKLQASIESSTTIRINSGDLVHQGCHARIPYSEYDEVTIDAGTTGYKRIDLIVARYEKNAGLESMSLVAIKGQSAASDPVAPDYNHGNIQQGANISDCPLYKVTLNGVNVESVNPAGYEDSPEKIKYGLELIEFYLDQTRDKVSRLDETVQCMKCRHFDFNYSDVDALGYCGIYDPDFTGNSKIIAITSFTNDISVSPNYMYEADNVIKSIQYYPNENPNIEIHSSGVRTGHTYRVYYLD